MFKKETMLITNSSVSIVMFNTVKVIRIMHYTHYPKFPLSFYPPNHLQKNIVSEGDKEWKKNPKQTTPPLQRNTCLFLQSTVVLPKFL